MEEGAGEDVEAGVEIEVDVWVDAVSATGVVIVAEIGAENGSGVLSLR